ncbi:hypothetical protein GQF03_02580 [Sneathiella chungangensis]|uniref:Uncharacterized protein n=1 Tax=Sneathiella chungangensis TaxID=1418234 RepID=A0A845MAR6_9PROT|nr:hypothetical protein [Sneathiella chungangensis]MZR21209.1 hypothetical protein [Sneathiella chungangensis]
MNSNNRLCDIPTKNQRRKGLVTRALAGFFLTLITRIFHMPKVRQKAIQRKQEGNDLTRRQASSIRRRYHVSPSFARIIAREFFGGDV